LVEFSLKEHIALIFNRESSRFSINFAFSAKPLAMFDLKQSLQKKSKMFACHSQEVLVIFC